MGTNTLERPQDKKVIAGVCAGIADRFGWSRNALRTIFVISCVLPGPQVLLYLALWLLMPKRE